MTVAFNGRELRSALDEAGKLNVSLHDVAIDAPADDEVIVRVQATPINPSDIALLFAGADLSRLTSGGSAERPTVTVPIAQERMRALSGRVGQSLPVGNEGAGTVVAAGANFADLEGRLVGMIGGAMYADYRKIKGKDVTPLPSGASAADGASMFVNPLTALGFVETARKEGHGAIIHTAAASNLGRMLQRICDADGITLINVVRKAEQVNALREAGATHVLNSSEPDFVDRLADVVAETGATIAFDAIGGGTTGSDILKAMERAAARQMTQYNRYGSDTFKKLYIYGMLDTSPTTIDRSTLGFLWSVSGWLLFPFLRTAGDGVVERLRARIASELTTTFASHYTRVISLSEALDPEVLRAYDRKATGEKFLIDPTLG
ncbi:zinc-binding dehydrogenase [Xanthobacteraceae bacterium A53D]